MKKIIGAFEKISFPDFGLIDIAAKIDTGAMSGSMHATSIREVKLPTGETAIRFKPYGKNTVTVSSFTLKYVKSSNGQRELRYIVPSTIEIRGVQYPIQISLADRTPMKFGTLIGRRFLRQHGFIVDLTKGKKYLDEVNQL